MDNEEIFARGVWQCIPDEDDSSWIERISEQEGSRKPLGDIGPVVKEMLAKGVSAETIARFAKMVGYETAFSICYHLADPVASYEGFSDDVEEIEWGLFEIDPESGEPGEKISNVHEILLSKDPTGRQMRPKNA